jgi:hypothetical protein
VFAGGRLFLSVLRLNQVAKSDDTHLISLQNEASQTASRVRTRINVDSIRSNVDFFARRMTMDDNLVERFFMKQEVVTDPKQILFALMCQRNSRPGASMGKEKVSACERQWKTEQETAVALR